MKFCNERFYQKKNKISRVDVKYKSCKSLQDFCPATLLKRDSNMVFFSEYSKSFRNSFFKDQLQWHLLNCVLVSERIFKKESFRRDCL